MRDQVQRKIEWSDPRDGTEWKALHDAPASSSELLPIEGKILAVDARCFFGRDVEDKYGAVRFDAGQLDWFASFLCESAGELIAALGNLLRYSPQHALALEGGQAPGGAKSLHRGGDCGLGMFAARLNHPLNHAAVEGRADFDDVAIFDPTAIDKKTVGCDWSDRQFRHFWSLRCGQTF